MSETGQMRIVSKPPVPGPLDNWLRQVAGARREMEALAVLHDRVTVAMDAADVVFVVPHGLMPLVKEFRGCPVVHADVDGPHVALPAR